VTNKKIHYIGHSQGTMIMFAALAEKNSEIKKLLASYIALGPVAYLDY
jgi:pimeloyl-ACP methyl ester carboxylesterase